MSHAKIRKEERWALKLLMGLLCAVHPWVVKATRPNICDEEHTIMNNAHYGTAAWTGFIAADILRCSVGHYTVRVRSLAICRCCCIKPQKRQAFSHLRSVVWSFCLFLFLQGF